ncbi:MAG: hypothetical protein E7311_00315 [Clostridiales bacterium]|nr:hypothetical protein [Clostridiales bacterium]
MSISCILGKSRIGKTTYIYNLIKEKYEKNLENNIKTLLIVPEQFGLTAEKELTHYLDKGGLFNVEILTFKRMCYRVFNEIGLDNRHITDVGKKLIIYDILSKNKFNIFNSSSKGNIENIIDIFSEFDRYKINIDEARNIEYSNVYLNNKMQDLLNIYEKYHNMLDEATVDSNNDLDILCNYISDSSIKNMDIYIDEFYGYTNQEYQTILELAKYNNVYISFCIDKTNISENPLDIYNSNILAYKKLLRLCSENGIKLDNTIDLNKKIVENNITKTKKEINHLANNIFSYPYKVYKDKVEYSINIYSCLNDNIEIENLAQNIVKLIDSGYKYSDIVVITRDSEKYANLIWGIFSKYKIPYFIDLKKNIIDNQISNLIFSLIDIVINNFSYEAVFSYLKTGFLDVDLDDIYLLENYVIKWGIKGHKWFKEFTYEYDENNQEVLDKLERLNIVREKVIVPLIEFKNNILKQKNMQDIVKCIYEFLDKNNIQKAIEEKINLFHENGEIDIEKEYLDIWNYYIETFDQLILSLGNSKIDIYEFKNILEIALTDTQKAFIPLYQDAVMIGDIERTRTHKVKVIFFIGVQNGGFPIVYGSEGILSDADREFLYENNIELAKTTKMKELEDQFNIYKIITMATDKVNFSYIMNDLDGVSYRPSFIISKIKKIFNINEQIIDNISNDYIYNTNTAFSNLFEEDNTEYIKYFKENAIDDYIKYENILKYTTNMNITLSKENIDKIYGDIFKGSITKLEEYVKCPYSFYLKYALKITEREKFQVRFLDIGNFNHEVLDEFFSYIISNNIDLNTITENEVEDIANNIIQNLFINIKSDMIKNAKNFNVLKIKLKKVLLKSIWVLILQLRGSSFKPIKTEAEFGDGKDYHKILLELNGGKQVHLIGKIDRIDLADTQDGKYIRIIDYKSSKKSAQLSDIYNGLNLQLITYLDAVTNEDKDIIPGGMLYFKIDDPIISTKQDLSKEELEKMLINELKLNGFILNDKSLIRHMDHNIEKTSNLVNVKINDEGLSTNKNALSLDEFNKLQQYSKKILTDISSEIMSGKIDVKPFWKSKISNGCIYCSFNGICKFNSKEKNCTYNIMRNLDNKEIFEKMGREK